MSLFFYSLTFAIICGTENLSQQSLSKINMVFSSEFRGQDFNKTYLKRYTAKSLTYEFPEKSWTKRGVNKLIKSCGVTGTFDQLTNFC